MAVGMSGTALTGLSRLVHQNVMHITFLCDPTPQSPEGLRSGLQI
jgi:hypothetical protein